MRDILGNSFQGSGSTDPAADLDQPVAGKRTLTEALPRVQRRGGAQPSASAEQVHEAAAAGLRQPAGALPHADQIQASFGRHDVSGVQAHVGGDAAEAADAMGAEAYATGDHVAFRGSPDLHTAAHEAAHVVQQRAGVHLKGGVGEAGDPYERHADAVADAVVQGQSAEGLLDQVSGGGGGGGSSGVQRKAITAAQLPGTAADGSGPIFDSKRITEGLKFKVTREVDNAEWPTVIAAYHTAIRPIGNVVASAAYTDMKLIFQNALPKQGTWGQKKAGFVPTAQAALKMPAAITLATHPDYAYWADLAEKSKDANRNNLRNNDDVGLIDPFLVEVEVIDRTHPARPPWRIETQFADSGSGYIKKIYNGAQDLGGSISTAQDFAANKNAAPADKAADYMYSSTHDQGGETFDARIGAISRDSGEKGGNSKGLDAVTWLAAEGARFAPMAKLGGGGSPESRFFTKPAADSWAGCKFVTAADLMRMWLSDFQKKYDVSTQELAAVVTVKGKAMDAAPPAGRHYNLTLDARHDQP